MKIIKFSLLFFLFTITACSGQESLNVEYLDVSEAQKNVHSWIEVKDDKNGIYLGKIEDENTIYVYVNYKNKEGNQTYNVPSITMTESKKELTLKIEPISSEHAFEKIFLIKRKSISSLNLNGQRFSIEQIENIE